MRWPWQRDNTCASEATESRRKAEVALAATRAETPLYKALGASLRDIREKNHIAEAIAHSIRGEVR